MDATTATLSTINAVFVAGTVADDASETVVVGAMPTEEAREMFTRHGWGQVRWSENGRLMAYGVRPVR